MSSLSYLPFFCLLVSSITGTYSASSSSSNNNFSSISGVEAVARFELHHLSRSPEAPPQTLPERVNEIMRNDIARQHFLISSHLKNQSLRRRRVCEEAGLGNLSSIEVPVWQEKYRFMALFRVGSPPQEYKLVADTGSHITWIKCNADGHERVFRANFSSSFQTVPCSSNLCKEIDVATSCVASTPTNTTQVTPCPYNIEYGDNSSTTGILANETVTVGLGNNGREIKLHDFLIGCGASNNGRRNFSLVDGILGLGNYNHSFPIKVGKELGSKKFSYCWDEVLNPSNNSKKNYLTFGGTNISTTSPLMQYTELLLDQQIFYRLNVTGISVGSAMSSETSQVWEEASGIGMVVDSGTIINLLMPAAYDPLMDALKPGLMKYNRVYLPNGTGFNFCFNTTTTGFDESLVPKLAIHFGDGVRFVPPVRNYVVEVYPGLRCLGFFRNTDQFEMSVIGSIMQQNYHWEFDLERKKLGFAPSATCA